MTRRISLFSLGLATCLAAALPQIAAAQSATLDPGLYDIKAVVTLGGDVFADVEAQECVREGENDKTLDDMLTGINEKKHCPVSNAVWTDDSVRADYVCESVNGAPGITGTIEASFGPDFLTVNTVGNMAPVGKMTANTEIKRTGDCPADWVQKDLF